MYDTTNTYIKVKFICGNKIYYSVERRKKKILTRNRRNVQWGTKK